MTTSPNEPQPNKVVQTILGLITLGGAIYLIYWGVKLFTL